MILGRNQDFRVWTNFCDVECSVLFCDLDFDLSSIQIVYRASLLYYLSHDVASRSDIDVAHSIGVQNVVLPFFCLQEAI